MVAVSQFGPVMFWNMHSYADSIKICIWKGNGGGKEGRKEGRERRKEGRKEQVKEGRKEGSDMKERI